MAGLLDSLDDPKTQGLLALGLRLMQAPGNFGQALGSSGLGALGDIQQARVAAERRKQAEQAAQMQALQMDQTRASMAQAQQMGPLQLQQMQMTIAEQQRAADAEKQRQAWLQSLPGPQAGGGVQGALAGGGGPTVANAAKLQQAPAADPMQAMMLGGVKAGAVPLASYLSSLQKDTAPIKLAQGERLLQPGTYRELANNPKAEDLPTAVREYQFAVGQGYKGTFDQWNKDTKKAGATNIGMPKIDIKMGESVAGQIGPMAKESRIQVQGAVGMFDSADRIQRALDSGKVSAGPFTTQVQTVKQLVQKVAGGNDDGIRQTRQVIKGLAQMSVEARKELAGQGQVTESEAAAVAKAESGDINDLTTGELQDLVTLTKRAAHMRAKSHQSIIESMVGSEATRGMVPFYQVPGADKLLKHDPQLPRIGGKGWSVQEVNK